MSRAIAAWILVMLAASSVGCRRRAECYDLDAAAEPALALAACKERFARTKEARAAVAVAVALAASKNDDGLIMWGHEVGALPGTALLWRRVGQAQQRKGHRNAMIAATERARELWRAAGELGEAAYESYVLRELYRSESRYVLALLEARRERELAAASTDRDMQRESFIDLFTVLEEIGDYAGAAAVIRQWQRAAKRDDPRELRALHISEGILHFREGRLELARLAQLDALAVPGGKDDPTNMRAAHYNLVEVAVALGQLELARENLAAAAPYLPEKPAPYMISARTFFTAQLALAQGDAVEAEKLIVAELANHPIPEWAWQLEELLGKALERQGKDEQALAAYKRAIDVVEAMRKDLPEELLQLAMRERKRAPYEAAFELLARRGEVAGAMTLAQALWRRGFAESFSPARSSTDSPQPAASPAEEVEVARVRELTALVEHLPAPGPDAPPATSSPALIVAFVEARGGLWRFVGDGPAATLTRLAISAADAKAKVAELRAHPERTQLGAALGAALLPPQAVSAAPERALAVITDGAVAGLPLAALRVSGKWLIELRDVMHWPSLGPSRREAPARASQPAVVMAASRPAAAAALPAAEEEARKVASALGVPALVGAPATVAALRGGLGAELLHLAAHGGVDDRGAFVELADGRLSASDILSWPGAPRVVVLASCASGARPQGSLWGALGGAFLAAGSEAVIATLWSVEDAATATLVKELYAADPRVDPVRALAVAQRKAIARSMPPRQWAAFVALGSP